MPATFVTPRGDLATPDGVVQGGGESSASGMLTRAREVRELEVEVARLEQAAEAKRTAQAEAEASLAKSGNGVVAAIAIVAPTDVPTRRSPPARASSGTGEPAKLLSARY